MQLSCRNVCRLVLAAMIVAMLFGGSVLLVVWLPEDFHENQRRRILQEFVQDCGVRIWQPPGPKPSKYLDIVFPPGATVDAGCMRHVEAFPYPIGAVVMKECRGVSAEVLAAIVDTGRSINLLDLSRSDVTDESFSQLRNGGGLLGISLRRTAVSDKGVSSLSSTIGNLETLELRGTEVRGPALSDLSRLKALRHLDLRGLPIDDSDFAAFLGNESLVSLDLFGTRLTDKSIRVLNSMPNLQRVVLPEAIRAEMAGRLGGVEE